MSVSFCNFVALHSIALSPNSSQQRPSLKGLGSTPAHAKAAQPAKTMQLFCVAAWPRSGYVLLYANCGIRTACMGRSETSNYADQPNLFFSEWEIPPRPDTDWIPLDGAGKAHPKCEAQKTGPAPGCATLAKMKIPERSTF